MIDGGGATSDWLRTRASLTPARAAVVAGESALTFADLDARVDAVARALRACGVAPGDRVALLLRNGLPFAELAHAVPRAGAVLVPLNTRLAPAELAWQVGDAGARLVVHDDANADAAGRLEPALTVRVDDLRGGGAVTAVSGEPIPLDRLHSIIYTSGTTGRPKGAMLTYGNHLWSALGSALNLGLDTSDRLLACLPLFHVGGLAVLLRGVIYGNAAVVHESFDAARANDAIDGGVTVVSVVANMLQRMLNERGGRPYPSHLRAVLLGGGPAPAPLLEACAARSVPVALTYGLTEAASQVATLTPDEAPARRGSAGKPLFPTAVRIARDDGGNAAPCEPGEILVRGATVSPGYWGRPEETARAFRDGWLYTGDAGYLDAEGYLYVQDRRDDLIVSGGENVYPAEIEAVLLTHPDVEDAGVFGAPDERWGKAPVACVRLRPGAAAGPESIIEHCRESLARYKAPARVLIVEEMPRTPGGKLQRRLLRERYG